MSNLKKIYYTLSNLSSLVLVNYAGDANTVATQSVIPGRMMQGVFASQMQAAKKSSQIHQDPEFLRLILEGGLIFTPAYPLLNEGCAFPLPLFLRAGKENPEKIYDTFAAEAPIQTKSPGELGLMQDSSVYLASVKKEIHFHHNSYQGKKDPLPFAYEALSAGQQFQGAVIGKEEDLKSLIDLMAEVNQVRIGRSRRTQYGQVKFSFTSIIQDLESLDLSNQQKSVIHFVSHALFYDDYAQSTLDMQVIQKYLNSGIEANTLKIEKVFMKAIEDQAYLSVWRLKQPSERCVQAGSSLELSWQVENQEIVQAQLQKFAQIGLGEKTHEGLGQIKIHLPAVTVFKRGLATELKQEIPEKIPEFAREILTGIIHNRQVIAVQQKALNDLDDLVLSSRIKKSLVTRILKALARQSDLASFFHFINSLKGKPAGDTLQKIRFKNFDQERENLFVFLTNEPILPDSNGFPQIEAFKADQIYKHKRTVYQLHYLKTFLTHLAMRIKSEGVEDVR